MLRKTPQSASPPAFPFGRLCVWARPERARRSVAAIAQISSRVWDIGGQPGALELIGCALFSLEYASLSLSARVRLCDRRDGRSS